MQVLTCSDICGRIQARLWRRYPTENGKQRLTAENLVGLSLSRRELDPAGPYTGGTGFLIVKPLESFNFRRMKKFTTGHALGLTPKYIFAPNV